jgi:putative transcriptional regulator
MPYTVRIRLKEVLQERSMSQQKLAELTDLRPSTISDLCRPKNRRIYLSTIAVLCSVLNISVDELIVLEPQQVFKE